MSMALLEVRNARLYYTTTKGIVKAVDNVSFELNEGETLASWASPAVVSQH